MKTTLEANNTESGQMPFVSVIMPVRNEAKFLERSLAAVMSQDYPDNRMEVLVVDGGSSDGTQEIATQMGAVLLHNPGKIVPIALNIGLQHAKGEIIVRVDGHCEIPPDYIRKCVTALLETGADCAGGIQKALGTTPIQEAIALATSSPFGVGNAYFHYATKPAWVDTVYLGAYKRKVFEQVGRFDEELMRNQDDEFNFRLTQAGGKIWLDPSISVSYYPRSSLSKLCSQYFQFGLYKVRVIQKRGEVASLRHLVPAVFLIALILSALLAIFTKQIWWLLLVAGPYIAVAVIATIFTGWGKWKSIWILPFSFTSIHLSYGLGFIAGLWHWRSVPAKAQPGTHNI
jgi:glycosyltransferase involved in cell wall biosynthesis